MVQFSQSRDNICNTCPFQVLLMQAVHVHTVWVRKVSDLVPFRSVYSIYYISVPFPFDLALHSVSFNTCDLPTAKR